jgi:hypothetical protein
MNIEPIKIDIEDSLKFGRVAFFVDRDDFLQDVSKARSELGLKKLISRQRAEDIFLNYRSRNGRMKIEFTRWDKASKLELNILKSMNLIIDIVNRYHNTNRAFAEVVKFSVICGVVKEGDIDARPYFINDWEFEENNDFYQLNFGNGAIVVYPDSTDKEVLEVFHDFKKKMNIPDTISNIKRDREWYWLKKKGKSYYQIAIKENKGNELRALNDKEAIRKAIKQYEKRLH